MPEEVGRQRFVVVVYEIARVTFWLCALKRAVRNLDDLEHPVSKPLGRAAERLADSRRVKQRGGRCQSSNSAVTREAADHRFTPSIENEHSRVRKAIRVAIPSQIAVWGQPNSGFRKIGADLMIHKVDEMRGERTSRRNAPADSDCPGH